MRNVLILPLTILTLKSNHPPFPPHIFIGFVLLHENFPHGYLESTAFRRGR